LSTATGVFNHNAHAVPAIIVGKIAQDPDTWMIHFHNGGNALSRPQPKDWHLRRVRNGIAIQRDDLKRVPRHRKAANLGSASIQDMEKDAFALLHANRFPVTEHASVDRKRSVADFVSVWHSLRE
jgi:hypothetical protein